MNKTRFAALLLCALFLLSLCACAKEVNPSPEPSPVEPTEPSTPTEPEVPDSNPKPVTCTDQTLEKTLTDEQGNALISIKLTVPMPENMSAAQQHYTDWLNDMEYYCSQELEDAAAARDTALQLGNVFVPYAYESDYQLLRNDGALLSIYRDYYANSGGAHPNVSTMAETFVVETGAQLVLDDVFSVPGEQYLPRIAELVKAMMDQKEKEYGDVIYYDNARDTLTDVYDPQNFALTDDSLLVFFPSYTLSAGAAGVQEFYLPLSGLTDILNTAWTAK